MGNRFRISRRKVSRGEWDFHLLHMHPAGKADCSDRGGCGLSSWSSSHMRSAVPDVSGSVVVRRPESSVRRSVTSWGRMLMNLEGGDARQTSGNCALAFFPFFQSFFPERIAERTVIIHLFGFRQILAADGNREENENQKNCSSKISHSLILICSTFTKG